MKCIVRRERVLKDGLDILPVFLFLLMRADIAHFPLEENFSLRWSEQSQKHLRYSGLSAAQFAYDRDDFAFVEIHIHMVDGESLLAAKPKYLGKS